MYLFCYNCQGLDGEATEPMIKELEEDREESQDPEVEFAIAGAVREYDGLEIILSMIQVCCILHLLSFPDFEEFLFIFSSQIYSIYVAVKHNCVRYMLNS